MHVVSDEYKAGMKQQLREHGYMEVVFGLINQEAMKHATIPQDGFTYFSYMDDILDRRENNQVFATFEKDFGRVDGSMYILPREGSASPINTGITGESLVTEGSPFTFTIDLNMGATDIKGITLDFPINSYPTDFDITTDDGTVFEVRNNTKTNYTTEHVFYNTTTLTMTVYSMSFPDTRLRIDNIVLGIGLAFGNADIMDSSLEQYVNPICADVPQFDFSVTLQNYDKYFDVDNPESAINFIETGQEMYVYYGMEIGSGTGNVEWFQGARMYCAEWEADDYSAQITCQDILRSMDDEYFKGDYSEDGTSLYDLAEAVFTDAGFEEGEYYIDPYLQNVTTKNPIPRVSHKEALQMIANAGRCVLTLSDDGIPELLSSFEPDFSVYTNGETPYSHAENIKEDDAKAEYASLAGDYGRVDRSMYFLTDDNTGGLYTGYVSDAISGDDGTFTENPTLTIRLESQHRYYGFELRFGGMVPESFLVHTYNDGVPIDTVEVTETDHTTSVYHEFVEFDEMVFEFTKTRVPHNRIVVEYFAFGDITDFTMERWDMMSSPKAYKEETVNRIDVSYYTYSKGGDSANLTSEVVNATAGDILEYYFSDPAYGYTATFNGSATNVSILDSGAYWIRLLINTTAEAQLVITANSFIQSTQAVSTTLHPSGSVIPWENPLIGDKGLAGDVADWLSEYYTVAVEYEYDTRGNPELVANDVIYQENAYASDMQVRVYDHTVNFGGAFSGSVKARRITPYNTGG